MTQTRTLIIIKTNKNYLFKRIHYTIICFSTNYLIAVLMDTALFRETFIPIGFEEF